MQNQRLNQELSMAERCFWCNIDPDEAEARHEGPHLTWCLKYRTPPLPAGVSRVTIGGVSMVVMEDPLMPPDRIHFSAGSKPEQNVTIVGLGPLNSEGI
jgi:hypothetical protein